MAMYAHFQHGKFYAFFGGGGEKIDASSTPAHTYRTLTSHQLLVFQALHRAARPQREKMEAELLADGTLQLLLPGRMDPEGLFRCEVCNQDCMLFLTNPIAPGFCHVDGDDQPDFPQDGNHSPRPDFTTPPSRVRYTPAPAPIIDDF
jgi:hypothetical protein